MNPNIYMVVISPSQKATKDAVRFKKLAEDTLGFSFRSRNSTPHVTLNLCEDFHNESKLYDIQDVISRTKPFNIFINGFGIFKSNGTIFLRLAFDENIRALSQQLSGQRIIPHITIARRLKPVYCDRVWKIFEGMTYTHSFLCSKIVVLKRDNNQWLKHIELGLGTSLFPN